jgi:hypothetical protein
MANESGMFSVDPDSVTVLFQRLAAMRDGVLVPAAAGPSPPMQQLVDYGLGFEDVRRSFGYYLMAVREYYERSVTCMDDLFRASLAAALRYEGTDARVAESMLVPPEQ